MSLQATRRPSGELAIAANLLSQPTNRAVFLSDEAFHRETLLSLRVSIRPVAVRQIRAQLMPEIVFARELS